MTRPPAKLFTLLLACAFAACSNTEDKGDAGGAVGNSEAGVSQPGAAGGAGNMDAGGGAPGGGGAAGGGAAGGGNRDGGGAAGGGNRDGGGAAGGTQDGGAAGGGGDGGSAGGADGGGGPTGPCNASAAPDVGKLRLEPAITGLSNLVYAAQPPGSQDWYLLQQSGQLLVRAAGATSNTMLLNLSSEITLSSGFGDDERGLLGIAFAPDFATSGLFYVRMTPTSGGNQDQVRQYQKMGSTAMLKETILTLPASAVNHNGGHIVMRDGLLYVGNGDGGGSCNNDKPGTPQQITSASSSWFGKILRLDPARKDANYAAEGNPFPDSPLVWHYGLRNPYRFGFDRTTGDMYIGDVGQDAYEEVHFAKAGEKGLNFGWPAFEAETSTCSALRDSLRAGSMQTKPVFTAERRRGSTGPYGDWRSVIGGVVYRGSGVPKLAGAYVTGDYAGARMVAFYQCDATTSPVRNIRKECDPNAPNEACFQGAQLGSLVAIVEDNAGELYFVANRNALLKVVPGT